MKRILVRGGKDPRTVLSPEQTLTALRRGIYGGNSGNMLFLNSVHRTLSVPDSQVDVDAYIHERRQTRSDEAETINNDYDHFVLPLANAFRASFITQLHRLTDLISKLSIPVTVVGVGAQAAEGSKFEEFPEKVVEATRGFMDVALEKSESIGVRGEYTADFLVHLGYPSDRIQIIGCPSMFTYGPLKKPIGRIRRLKRDSRIALNYTPTVYDFADFVDFNTHKYHNSVMIAQQHHRLALLLWGDDPNTNEDTRLPITREHKLYREDRIRHFVDTTTWIDFLRQYDFSTGTRIHGNIAATLAGIPAVMLAHDSRTAELAKYHGIPFQILNKIPRKLDVAELYAKADYSGFNKRQQVTFDTFLSFLRKNRLVTIYDDGRANPAYDESIARLDFPGPVKTLYASGEEGRTQIIERLNWLRQGQAVDRTRHVYAYSPELAPRSREQDLDYLASTVKKLKGNVQELSREFQSFTDRTEAGLSVDRKELDEE